MKDFEARKNQRMKNKTMRVIQKQQQVSARCPFWWYNYVDRKPVYMFMFSIIYVGNLSPGRETR